MPRLAPYLQRRGSGFTFRISVPPELRQLIGAREFTKALSETNHEAASPTALEFAAAAKRLFFEVREMKMMGTLSQEQIKAAIGKGKESLKLSALSDELWDERADSVVKQLRLKRAMAEREQKHALALEEAVRVARLEGENAGFLKALEAQQRPIHVEVAQVASASLLLPSAPTPKPLAVKAVPTLGMVVDAFLAQYEKRGKPQMLKKHRPTLNMLVEVVGDKPVNELRQAHLNEFFDVLTILPPRWSDQCRQRKLSV